MTQALRAPFSPTLENITANQDPQSPNDLSACNTMALSCQADEVVLLTSEEDVEAFFSDFNTKKPLVILSGGSNVLLPSQLEATVLRPLLFGIQALRQSLDSVDIEVMAGENWHELVQFTVAQGWFGLENLALIPGLTGASPVQNIGAYGVQLEDCLTHVHAYHLPSKSWQILSKADCKFGYRDSIFKQHPNTWLITKVGFRLHKDPSKVLMNYGDVASIAQDFAEKNQRPTPTPLDVMNAIIDIRTQKLPDPKILANCGSFFQNPVIPQQQFDALQAKFADITIPSYPMPDQQVKVAAGWLIEKAGLKGSGIAPILTHDRQALVLTNHAPFHATQLEVAAAQDHIINSIADKFGITISREPVWINRDGSIGLSRHER